MAGGAGSTAGMAGSSAAYSQAIALKSCNFCLSLLSSRVAKSGGGRLEWDACHAAAAAHMHGPPPICKPKTHNLASGTGAMQLAFVINTLDGSHYMAESTAPKDIDTQFARGNWHSIAKWAHCPQRRPVQPCQLFATSPAPALPGVAQYAGFSAAAHARKASPPDTWRAWQHVTIRQLLRTVSLTAAWPCRSRTAPRSRQRTVR